MNEIIQKTLEYLNSAEAFLTAQVPDFINQFLMWCFYEKLFFIALFPILFLFFLTITIILKRTLPAKENFYLGSPTTPHGFLYVISYILTVVAIIISLVSIPFNTYDLIKIKVAPKVYLVEKVMDMVKK